MTSLLYTLHERILTKVLKKYVVQALELLNMVN